MELMHFIAFRYIFGSDWILFYRGKNNKLQVCSKLQPIFSSRILRLHIFHFSVYKMEICWPNTLYIYIYLYIIDLFFESSFILLDFFQLDLVVYPGISLISPRLRLATQEPFPSNPIFYSIVVLV